MSEVYKIVSLEAIFLSTFVLSVKTGLSEEIGHRADLALQVGRLTEHELTRVLQMLDAVHAKLAVKIMRKANLPTMKWKPSSKMCWLKSCAFNAGCPRQNSLLARFYSKRRQTRSGLNWFSSPPTSVVKDRLGSGCVLETFVIE